MKRYDKFKFIESRQTGVKGYDLTEEEFKKVINEHHNIFKVYVQCRKCENIHEINNNCQVCDIETKIKPR